MPVRRFALMTKDFATMKVPASGSHETRRWREMDSKCRYPVRETTFCGMPPFRSPVSHLPPETGSFVPGTDGSNPFPSSGESTANLACRNGVIQLCSTFARRCRMQPLSPSAQVAKIGANRHLISVESGR
jgi:hypothetical protein